MTKRQDLDQLAVIVNNTIDANQMMTHYIQGAYGRVRLVRAMGSVEVSPSLTKPELEMWIRAYIAGLNVGKALGGL